MVLCVGHAWQGKFALALRLLHADPMVGTHDTSRNLDPQLHTRAVIANMVQGEDGGTPRSGKWRTMANVTLYTRKMLTGMVYRSELAHGLEELGYRVEKTHADGRFEIAGVPRAVIDALSTRRAEIETAMDARGIGDPGRDPHLAARAALMTCAHKRDVDREALRESWHEQAVAAGFSADVVVEKDRQRRAMSVEYPGRTAERSREHGVSGRCPAETARSAGMQCRADAASQAAVWATAHLSEREAVCTTFSELAVNEQ